MTYFFNVLLQLGDVWLVGAASSAVLFILLTPVGVDLVFRLLRASR